MHLTKTYLNNMLVWHYGSLYLIANFNIIFKVKH